MHVQNIHQIKHKKIISSILILALTALLCACGQADTIPDDTASADLPILKIGADILKPFFYVDENGAYTGIDADIITEACRRAGYKPEFIEVSWGDRDSYLGDGTVDCLWNAFIMDGREDAYLWTDSYLQSDLRAIINQQSPVVSLSDFYSHEGMPIAVRAGSRIEDVLLDQPSISIYTCGTFTMAETAFVKGYVVALGGHEVVLQQVIHDYPDMYQFLDGSIMTAHLGVAFSKDDTSDHCEKINDALRSMKADGTVTAIFNHYYSDSPSKKEVPANEEA